MKTRILLFLGALLAWNTSFGQALLTVTSPNGGETLTACDNMTVTYTKSATASDVQRIEVSFNAGRTYFEVAQLTTTGTLSGSITIPVPNVPTVKARVRVRELNGGTNQSDASDANFTIGLAGTLPPFFITQPTGVPTFPVASTQRIQWGGPADHNYRLSYSFSTTSGFVDIATVTGRNYYDWNIPSQSTRLYIRVQDIDVPCAVAYSDTLFRSSSTVQGIGLTTFNGGEVVNAGESYSVRWNTNAITQDTLVLEFSSNNGSTWQVLSDSVPRTGSYGWTVPAISTTQALFRISVKGNAALNDVSNSAFTIQSSSIRLASQSVAGPLTGCQNYTVNWSAVATSGFYKVIVSPNGGQTWYPASGTLAYGPTGSFSKVIKVPSLNSTNCLLAVIDPFTPTNRDTTNSPFTISSSTPLLGLTYPVGGEVIGEGAAVNITWTTAGSVPNVDLSYSADAGQNWQVIATGVANTGSRSWTAPTGLQGAAYLVRVQASTDSCLASQSNLFSVSNAGVVDILFPTGGEIFQSGQAQNIRWQASGLGGANQVKIEFSSDAGGTYTEVATVANTGSYAWAVPTVSTTSGRIRVSDASNPAVQASSPGNFTILVNQPPTANAGIDVFIRLPANAVTVNGSGADPENGNLSYAWSQVSGPSGPILTNADTRVFSASPLVQGRYVFRLTVTDNGGLTATDDMVVNVLPDTGRARTAWNWVKKAGSSLADRGNRIVSDAEGNLYVVGGFSGSASFSDVALTSAGGMDGFVAKYDSTGEVAWVRQIGNTADDEALSICLLADGNLAVSGFFNRSLNLDGNVVTSRGSQDAWIAVIDPNGSWQWVRNGGSIAEDQATAITSVDGSIYAAGFVAGNGVFGSVSTTGLGNRDAFVARYDLTGNAIWVKIIGSSTRDQAFGISSSSFGLLSGIVVCGFVSGTVNIGGNAYPSIGGNDAFTVAYQSDGSLSGFRRFGGTGNDVANAVAIGSDPLQGEAFLRTYVAGSFSGSMALPGGPTLVSAGQGDAFVVAFDFSGGTPVAVRMGSTGDDAAKDLALSQDRLWVTGSIVGKQGANGPRAFGAQDVFVSRHQFDGTQLQLLQAGGQSVDDGRGIATSVNGSAAATGLFRFSGKFGPYELGEFGQGDMFVGRITNAPLINFRQGDAEFVWTSNAPDARLMPNPAARGAAAHLEVSGLPSEASQATLTIQDLSGRTLVETPVSVQDGYLNHTLAAPMEAGVYLIRVQTSGATPVVRRLTVQ